MEREKQNLGKCYLVGAGPGDPGLLTLRAKELLERAQVLVYDYLANPVLLNWLAEDCEKIYVGKKAGDHTLPQEEINELIVRLCREGKQVVRLKGGDPFVFGRGGEEAEELAAAGVSFEIIPGVTSGIAAPAYAGIPVTHRSHNTQVTFITGHEDPSKETNEVDWGYLAKGKGTLVLYMAVGRMSIIAQELREGGKPPETPIALIRWGTMSVQQELVGTLATIAKQIEQTGFKAPAIAVIGDVVSCRQSLDWLREARPLLGKRVVITRTREKASELAEKFTQLGARVLEMPLIRTEKSSHEEQFHELVQQAHQYDWLVFTSPTGVDRFFESFFAQYDDARSIGGVRIAAVGPATAKQIRLRHLAVDAMPQEAHAEALVESILEQGSVDNLKVLWVRPEKARPVVRDLLSDHQAIVDEAFAYKTVAERVSKSSFKEELENGEVDWITFASSSAAENFVDLGVKIHEKVNLASIGPITSKRMRELNLVPTLEASEFNLDGMVEAVVNFERSNSSIEVH